LVIKGRGRGRRGKDIDKTSRMGVCFNYSSIAVGPIACRQERKGREKKRGRKERARREESLAE